MLRKYNEKQIDNLFNNGSSFISSFFPVKQLNRHLIAVGQFILSVVAGFAFGFLGIELLVGRLDFGFRLLLGIICGLTIALAELYFLAKTLNEDINFTLKAEELSKTSNLS